MQIMNVIIFFFYLLRKSQVKILSFVSVQPIFSASLNENSLVNSLVLFPLQL